MYQCIHTCHNTRLHKYLYEQTYCDYRIIGTPLESDWPENVSIMWNCFEPRRGIPIKQIIPQLCDNSEDVLMVNR